MTEQMRSRLATLKKESENGERQLRELMHQEAGIRETLLRISGAIQVLEELLTNDAAGDTGPDTATADAELRPAVLRVP